MQAQEKLRQQTISIHALRKESDPLPTHRRPSCAYFNPRSP